MSKYYNTCCYCGANLDPNEKCDCKINCCVLGIDVSNKPDFGIKQECLFKNGKLYSVNFISITNEVEEKCE